MSTERAALVAALLLMLAAPPAWGERCPVPAGASPALAEVDSSVRLAAIGDGLEASWRPGRTWAWIWVGVHTGVAGVDGARALLSEDEATQIESAYGAFTSVVGLASLVIEWPRGRQATAWVAAARGRGASDCATLAEAERRLAEAARLSGQAFTAKPHLLGVGFALSVGLTIGLVHDRWESALLVGGLTLLGGELRVWTRPRREARLWKAYRRGALTAEPAGAAGAAALVPVALPGGGAALVLVGEW